LSGNGACQNLPIQREAHSSATWIDDVAANRYANIVRTRAGGQPSLELDLTGFDLEFGLRFFRLAPN
jgi:hypothetical protein